MCGQAGASRWSTPTGKPGMSSRQRRLHRGRERDRGAAAVEFALLLPLLLVLVFGIIDFGRALNAEITLTQAAREGARLDALGQTNATVVTRTQTAATGLGLAAGDVAETLICVPNAGATADAKVTVSYQFSFVTPVGALVGLFGGHGLGGPISLTAQGVMPCET